MMKATKPMQKAKYAICNRALVMLKRLIVFIVAVQNLLAGEVTAKECCEWSCPDISASGDGQAVTMNRAAVDFGSEQLQPSGDVPWLCSAGD